MAKSAELTTGNFKRKLSALVSSAKTQRENIQKFLVFAMAQYKDHGNLSYLTMLLEACVGVRSMPTQTIKDYIKAHANVKYIKGKGGNMVFKKDGKAVKVTEFKVTWYDWKGGKHQATADLDALARTRALLTNVRKAISEGHIKEGQEEFIRKLESALNSVLKA